MLLGKWIVLSFIDHWRAKILDKRKKWESRNHAQFHYSGFVGFVLD